MLVGAVATNASLLMKETFIFDLFTKYLENALLLGQRVVIITGLRTAFPYIYHNKRSIYEQHFRVSRARSDGLAER